MTTPTTERAERTCTACGARCAGAGASTPRTSTPAAPRSTERMLELTAPRPGDRVLELACGPGGLGLAAAGASRPAARSWSPTSPRR